MRCIIITIDNTYLAYVFTYLASVFVIVNISHAARHFDRLALSAIDGNPSTDPWSYITLYSERFYSEPQPIYRLIRHKKGYCHCGVVALLFRSVWPWYTILLLPD